MSYSRLLILLSITAGLVGLLAGPALAKPPSGIDLKVAVGYDGIVQQGRINPVMVDLKNASANKNLSGELALRYNDVEYVTPLELPTPSQKRLYLYFPCDNAPPYLTLTVRTKQYTEEFDLSDGSYFKTAQPADTSIVVLSNQSGSLGAVNQLDTVRLHRDLYEAPTTDVGSSKTFVSYFKLDQIDPNPKFFDRADVIVLADVDYQLVTPQLAETLKACAAGGTSIIFSLGLNGAGVTGSPLADLCPLQTSGTVQLTDLGQFGQRYGFSTAAGQATFAVGNIAPGATVLSSAGQYPAVVRAQRGSGTITALAFDFTAKPFKQNPRLGALMQDTVLAVPQNVEVRNWFVHPEPVSKKLQDLEEAKPILPQFVLLFIAAYVALIGPLNFLVLRRLKRQTLIWATIPALILGFSYGGLETGRVTRGADNVTATFEELHVYPGASYVPYQSVMLVFTAERTKYKLEVPDASAFLFADIPHQAEQYGMNTGGIRGLTGSKLDLTGKPLVTTTQGKWTSKEYFYQGYAQLPMTATSALTAVRAEHGVDDLQGSFTLDMPYDLHDCYLYTGASQQPIGDLAGKGTYDIAQLHTKAPSTPDLKHEDYLYSQRETIADLQREASRVGLDYRDETLLVGFMDKLPVESEFKRNHKSHTLTMVVVHLPYTQRFLDQGPSGVRTLITGGTGFKVDRDWNYAYSGNRESQLTCNRNDSLDLTLQLLGGAAHATRFDVTVNAEMERNKQVDHVAQVLTVYAWDGNAWRELRINPDFQKIDSSLTGLADADHTVKLRLVSQVDNLHMSLPTSTAYGISHQKSAVDQSAPADGQSGL